MNFPRETVRIGECLAIVCTAMGTNKYVKIGEPIRHHRPKVRFEGELWRAHRLAYHLNVAKIPRLPKGVNRLILHTCDQGWCVEPSHLYRGSQKRNMMDVSERHPTIRATRSNLMKGNKIGVRADARSKTKPWATLGISERTWYRRALNRCGS